MEDPIDNLESFLLKDEIVNAIIMHRDAHFSGSFDLMIDYYRKEGKGVHPEFSLDKICEISFFEEKLGHNISGLLLSGPEAEEVRRSKDAYKRLRDLYENKKKGGGHSLLIADLILTESEEAEEEIEAIVAEKGAIVPSLIQLMSEEDYSNPLFPGYGQAPQLAMQCLERIGDKRAIISLFECIGRRDVLDEERAIQALRRIGAPAKAFLTKVLASRPVTEDCERAAIALIHFSAEDPGISKLFLEMLKDEAVRAIPTLATYLIIGCEHLSDPQDRKEFAELFSRGKASSIFEADIKWVMNTWKRQS